MNKSIRLRGGATIVIPLDPKAPEEKEEEIKVNVTIAINIPQTLKDAMGLKDKELTEAVEETYGYLPILVSSHIASSECFGIQDPDLGNECVQIFYDSVNSAIQEAVNLANKRFSSNKEIEEDLRMYA